ncbi:xylosyl- and glucuronyltransferase LARGE1-like [Ptychodera flava]|uniref:xylosyl- and glucuronyltransferase LARGE1-like n=1 Tax=Ptychodera flava TaxID=63121 RepID=UPI00396A3CA7
MMIASRKTLSVFTICIFLQTFILASFLLVMTGNQYGGPDTEIELQKRTIHFDPVPCETIHILVCVPDLESVRSLGSLIKSVLVRRTNPVQFHLVADDQQVNATLHTLFSTWRLLQGINIYSPEDFIALAESENRPFTKLILTEPKTVFTTEIDVIWSEIYHFGSREFVGLVGTMWDANPFNRGLVLLDVEKMQKYEMMGILKDVAMETKVADTGYHERTSMKRLWKSFTEEDSPVIHLLPCYWYIETTFRCFDSVSEVLSFNSKTVIEEDGQMGFERRIYFKTVLYSIQDLDGNLLRHRNITCNMAPEKLQSKVIEQKDVEPQKPGRRDPRILCSDFYKRETLVLRTHHFFIGNLPKETANNDVTLSVQTDFNRLIQMSEMVATYWTGPISMAVYANDRQAHEIMKFATSSRILKTRHDIAIHIGFEERSLKQYPFNHMRNIALRPVRTPFVYISEIDFLYKPTIYEDIRRRLGNLLKSEETENQAIVVPAFETDHLNLSYIPKSKNELKRLYSEDKLRFFHSLDFSKGHEATNFTRWTQTNVPYSVNWQLGYEPYLVLSKRGLPEFPLLFSGMGRDKIIYTQMLKLLGYKLSVSPNTYMVHMPHWPSSSKKLWDADGNYRWCVYQLTSRFLKKFLEENRQGEGRTDDTDDDR